MNALAYDLHLLGWHSFQQLCLAITREIFGQTVESFLDSNDGGRDGAFSGQWNANGEENLNGRFVIQCKFTSKKNSNFSLSDLSEEIEKVKRLVAAKKCDCYIIMTNAGLSGTASESIEDLLKNLGVKQVRIYGSTWICSQIHENKRLRMLVPRVYGLGDLSQIIDERAYSQARQLLSSLHEDLSKVVITESYNQAANALDKHGFVLLIGEPAAGKTTIASMLAMAALDQWRAYTLKLDIPTKVVDHWNPDDPSQFFWIDDAFGVNQYESNLVHGWNHILPQIRTMLNQGIKIVMTSRDYIYKRARNDLREGAFPLFNESQVVIDVHNLSISEKQQILYNHLKLGRQEKSFLKTIKEHLNFVAEHPRFIPETARRLSDTAFTKNLYVSKHHIERFVHNQESFLQEVLQGLDKHSKAALALIYMNNDHLVSPIDLNPSEKIAIERLGSNLGSCIDALDSMNGSIVQHLNFDDQSLWRFKHPTIGDAYASIVVKNPELLEIYVRGTSIQKLTEQITCGDAGLERAIIIRKPMFAYIIERLCGFVESEKYKSPFLSTWYARRSLHSFLATRCSSDFLTLYIQSNPGLFEDISEPSLSLSISSEVDLALKLQELKLLPEKYRKAFVEKVTRYAVTGEDLYALENDKFQTIFDEKEFINLKHELRLNLIPNLRSVRREWESNYSSHSDQADEHMETYLDILNTLQSEFQGEQTIIDIINTEKAEVEEWIGENSEEERLKRPERELGKINTAKQPISIRSIFDDIEE
jgi:energy-coupling factor transporter ATP-binding protein EcfA2